MFKKEADIDFLNPFICQDEESDTPHFFRLDTADLAELDQYEVISTLNAAGNLLAADQEVTMDVASKYEVPKVFPVSPRGPPERNNFAGEFNFSVEVKSQDTHKKKYLYSHLLNRIYVDREQNFSMQFVWDYTRASSMLVRATTVFSDISQAEKRVERCVQHLHDPHNNAINEAIVQNVLHSSRELGTLGVHYCGDPSLADSWYSVLVEFTPTGNETCNHAFKFVCKNSCSTGINRRAIDIIFTLEDRELKEQRKALNLVKDELEQTLAGSFADTLTKKAASTPFINKLRQILDILCFSRRYSNGKKRMSAPAAPPAEPRSKKIKLEHNDDVINVPPMQLIGSRAVVTGLEVTLSMMQQAASFKKNDQQALDKYNTSIQTLRTIIDDIKNGAKPPPPGNKQ